MISLVVHFILKNSCDVSLYKLWGVSACDTLACIVLQGVFFKGICICVSFEFYQNLLCYHIVSFDEVRLMSLLPLIA